MPRRPMHDRHRRPQGPPGPDPDHRCRVRRLAGASLAALGRPASTRALVGAADLPGHLHQARPGAGQPRRVPHDRSRGRPAARLLGHRRGGPAAVARVPRRLRQRRRLAEHRPRAHDRPGHDHPDQQRTDPDVDPEPLPQHRGDGTGPRHGRRGGPQAGRRSDRRHPGRRHHVVAEAPLRSPQMTTQTLDVPGATPTYDVQRNDASTEPILLLIGSPMGAAGFGTLSQHFSDRTVVTYDPRGGERSLKTDPTSPVTPEVHADDLHRLIQAIGGGPVDLFATSGGAVNALALVAKHPEEVRTLVAHEPPLASVLPDRECAMAANRDIHETYQRSGLGPAMAKFIAIASHKGPITPDLLEAPAPDPAMFGLPAEDDGSRDDPLIGQNIVSCTHYEPDLPALQAASTQIVLAAGTESEGE